MSKINIELFGNDAELVSFDGEEGGTLSFEFPTLYDGYISLANQTARITGRECTVSTVNIENGEYIPHLILTDRTIDLPKIRVLHGVISPVEPDRSHITRLSLRERRLCERVYSLEKRLDELTKKVTGSSLFSAMP